MSVSNNGIFGHGIDRHGVSLKRGSRLRYALHDNHGKLLLVQGAEITERVQSLLQLRGITLDIQAKLKVTSGPSPNAEIPVRSRMTIGRLPTCDIQLANEIVSGIHSVLEKRPAGVFLQDLGSKNGTFLNDESIRDQMELSDQDTIRVGHTIFTVQIYAALSTDSEESSQSLKAWILAEPGKLRTPSASYTPTAADIDLGPL